MRVDAWPAQRGGRPGEIARGNMAKASALVHFPQVRGTFDLHSDLHSDLHWRSGDVHWGSPRRTAQDQEHKANDNNLKVVVVVSY